MVERHDGRRLRVALITSAPAPYRVPAYAAAAASSGWDWHILYCARPYIDPDIPLTAPGVTSHFLPGRFLAFERRFVHADPAAWRVLTEVQPDVVITTGFIPSYLLAYAWARRHGRPHVAMTDGTLCHEAHLSAVHRALRRWVYRRSAAGIGASRASMALLQQYGMPADRCHPAPICTDNRPFAPLPEQPRPVDMLFSARFVETKQPLFALEVAHRTAERLGRPVRLRWLGAGPLEPRLRERAAERARTVHSEFLGWRPQAELPALYREARLFLFPTTWEAWGLVANEACAAGVPVFTTPEAGCAGELVVDGVSGRVGPLDAEAWSRAAAGLLSDTAAWSRLSQGALQCVAPLTFDAAAAGLVGAVRQALASPRPGRPSP